jgi:NAD(P)-dependent dehydrogenase (short-subunit alcohol dehydrogenase family)
LDRLSSRQPVFALRDSLAAVSAKDRGAVLISGSSTGIGRASALRLDRAGFQVFAGVRNRGDAESLEDEASDRLEPVILDVTDEVTIAATAERIRQVTGGRLAGLVNNAGIAKGGPIEALAIDDLRHQLEVNLIGQVAVTQAMLPMIRAARGRVVFMSSIGGKVALPYISPYAASKHAIEAVGDSLRREMHPFGVQVSLVEPGAVATPIWDKGSNEAAELRERASAEQIEAYGPVLDRFEKLFIETGRSGVPPDDVADAVEHALTAAKPKTRYLIGRQAKIRAAVARYLPDRFLDRGVARQLGG